MEVLTGAYHLSPRRLGNPHAGVFCAFHLQETDMPDRAVLFVDGNNWFHSLRKAGVDDLFMLDYAKISTKLVGPRVWLATRYYIGQVRGKHSPLR